VSDITHDLADDGFHEIQLSGKQLVFLFMATTAISVLIFLCGVLVGRNAQVERPTEAADAALTTPAPAPTPVREQATAQVTPAEPPSPPADDELTYRKRLESESAPSETLKSQAAAGRPAADAAPAPADAARATAGQLQPAPAAARAGADPSAPAGAGARQGRWVVQLVALRDRGAASSIVQRLIGKGYPAFMVNPAASTPNQVFKVQVGRYDDRGEAETIARRLAKEEKFKPWISR
jgi:septal ring-binding cell division protein DamX